MKEGTHFNQGGHSTYRVKDWLYNQYVTKEKSLRYIANKCNVDHQNIRYWLHKFSIPIHRVGDFPMERSAQWKGGQRPYSKYFNRELKKQIRNRDNNTCQLCHINNYHQNLDVHHIDYNKKNCSSLNLISLCRRCHLKTNHGSRKNWISLFLSMNG